MDAEPCFKTKIETATKVATIVVGCWTLAQQIYGSNLQQKLFGDFYFARATQGFDAS